MQESTSSVPKTRLKKGEQTRRRILEATLGVIAKNGLRAVTHRAVAAEAGVQLSLTTYYFRDIDDLLLQAFGFFCEQSKPGYQEVWSQFFEYLDRFSGAELRKQQLRQDLCERLSEEATAYLVEQVRTRPVGLAVEQTFFTEVRLSPQLRKLAREHRQTLLDPLQRLCAYFNTRDPEIDAELLLDSLARLEYQALLTPPDRIDQQLLMRLVRRQIGWAMGLKRA